MAARTYIPHLLFVLNIVKRYIERWQIKLGENSTTQQSQCVAAVLEAVLLCIQAYGPQPINP